MYAGYYQPYWSYPDELEYYGVKGMKWGARRTPAELKGVKFSETKVSEIGNWLLANPIQFPDVKASATISYDKAKKSSKAMRSAAKVKVSSLKMPLIELGKKFINAVLNIFKKK